MIRIKSLLKDSNQLLISQTFLGFHSILLTIFGLSLHFVDFFGVFIKFCRPFLGVPLERLDSNQLMIQAVSQGLQSIQLMTQRLSRNWLRINSWLKWIPKILVQIDSWLKVLPDFSIEINSWLNQKEFDSESALMIRLWVLPMSANNRHEQLNNSLTTIKRLCLYINTMLGISIYVCMQSLTNTTV